jgi:hypothetical protein
MEAFRDERKLTTEELRITADFGIWLANAYDRRTTYSYVSAIRHVAKFCSDLDLLDLLDAAAAYGSATEYQSAKLFRQFRESNG